MNQKVKLIIIILVIIISNFAYNKLKPRKKYIKLKKTIVLSERRANEKIDINSANLKDYVKAGVSLRLAKKIFDYKQIVGKVDNMSELIRIAGIGSKSIKKLEKKIYVSSIGQKNKLNINSATEKELKYYGFTSKEIRKIKKYIKKNRVVNSNIQLMGLLDKKRYLKYENIISYN